ncbi:MAG: hypothetical protein C0617_08075 [Desulfuromonas sp.]|uniref:sulfotransferase family protein n=1 Tax=Desulfuromonas sp. TaxID=892 RepID=UPI000CB82C3A|nr:sulfotransferase [Desulfuromonas sp.]PLX84431.1 MAG: hypothetical protein C0617_08075 [Desulfuromonas sp.]
MKKINVSKEENYIFNTAGFEVSGGKECLVKLSIKGVNGSPYSFYFCVCILDEAGKEIKRFIKWVDDFSGKSKKYSLVFSVPEMAHKAVLGYRGNVEGADKSDLSLALPDLSENCLRQVEGLPETFDDLKKRPPRVLFTIPELDGAGEQLLEKNIVGIFGSPRTGSTWLGQRLLKDHKGIANWQEPYLGNLLGTNRSIKDPLTGEMTLQRVHDKFAETEDYFFSNKHKKYWLAGLNKMILYRAFAQCSDFSKKIVFKEPNGSQAADIIMEALPNAKMIFLLRDGRDVVDSLVDLHRKGSWNQRPTLDTKQKRLSSIANYSKSWRLQTEVVKKAFENHDEDLRLLVKYEKLKSDTFAELKNIFEFIGVDASDKEVSQRVDKHDFKNIPTSEKGPGKFNRAASTGGWRDAFAEEEIDLMHSIMGETLLSLGYGVR